MSYTISLDEVCMNMYVCVYIILCCFVDGVVVHPCKCTCACDDPDFVGGADCVGSELQMLAKTSIL